MNFFTRREVEEKTGLNKRTLNRIANELELGESLGRGLPKVYTATEVNILKKAARVDRLGGSKWGEAGGAIVDSVREEWEEIKKLAQAYNDKQAAKG